MGQGVVHLLEAIQIEAEDRSPTRVSAPGQGRLGHIYRGQRNLRCVDGVICHCLVDLARRQLLRRDTELLHHPRAQAEEPHPQALQISGGPDLLVKPPGSLRRPVRG